MKPSNHDELDRLRVGLDDMLWRLTDIRKSLICRTIIDTPAYGLDEWSTPIVNLDIAIKKLGALKVEDYPKRDLTPEHTLRGNDHDSDAPIHPQLAAAYEYEDAAVDAADIEYGGAPAWLGWALREAFLAGCSHVAKTPS